MNDKDRCYKKGRRSDVGYDFALHSEYSSTEDLEILPQSTKMFKLNCSVPLPEGYGAVISLRTSTCIKYPGLIITQPWIDPGFTGIPMAILTNTTRKTINLKQNDEIFSIVPLKTGELIGKVEYKKNDDRNDQRFGSTDK